MSITETLNVENGQSVTVAGIVFTKLNDREYRNESENRIWTRTEVFCFAMNKQYGTLKGRSRYANW